FEQALPEECELRLAHVVALRRLQQVLIGHFLDLLHDALGRHTLTFLKRHKRGPRTRHAATTGPSGQLRLHLTRRQSAARLLQQTVHYISNRSVQATPVTGLNRAPARFRCRRRPYNCTRTMTLYDANEAHDHAPG